MGRCNRIAVAKLVIVSLSIYQLRILLLLQNLLEAEKNYYLLRNLVWNNQERRCGSACKVIDIILFLSSSHLNQKILGFVVDYVQVVDVLNFENILPEPHQSLKKTM